MNSLLLEKEEQEEEEFSASRKFLSRSFYFLQLIYHLVPPSLMSFLLFSTHKHRPHTTYTVISPDVCVYIAPQTKQRHKNAKVSHLQPNDESPIFVKTRV